MDGLIEQKISYKIGKIKDYRDLNLLLTTSFHTPFSLAIELWAVDSLLLPSHHFLLVIREPIYINWSTTSKAPISVVFESVRLIIIIFIGFQLMAFADHL